MAKDPRFNFYPDNWDGGTEGFTLEQEGAYLALIIMQSRKGKFTKDQAMDKLLQKTRGNAAACATLWDFLLPKFETDGTLYWSARLIKEVEKSKNHSKKQSERANKRWGNNPAHAAAVPVYRNRIGSGNRTEEKGGTGENKLLSESEGPPTNETQQAHTTAEASAQVRHIGKVNGHRITIRPVYAHDVPIIIHDLQEYFHQSGQLTHLVEAGWNKFAEFMKANPAAIFNDPGHLYNSYRKYCLAPPPPGNGPTGTLSKRQLNRQLNKAENGQHA